MKMRSSYSRKTLKSMKAFLLICNNFFLFFKLLFSTTIFKAHNKPLSLYQIFNYFRYFFHKLAAVPRNWLLSLVLLSKYFQLEFAYWLIFLVIALECYFLVYAAFFCQSSVTAYKAVGLRVFAQILVISFIFESIFSDFYKISAWSSYFLWFSLVFFCYFIVNFFLIVTLGSKKTAYLVGSFLCALLLCWLLIFFKILVCSVFLVIVINFSIWWLL